ncbi:MAG TPA: prepilin-type N-terminal cleavage/methylation domain-containing protein [Candidatus Babeliaceae bacterium]|nr:prepilin-type N-terminal cleavage/methylation domain-containing protein [Candidatus Babeliaceae bacterium]
MPKGFTLLEIVIAILLIGIMSALIVPRITRRGTKPEDELVTNLSALTQVAATNALMTGKLHRILFDFKRSLLELQQEREEKGAQEKKFDPVKIDYLKTAINWPDVLELRNFYINGKDEMTQGAGISTPQVWFFISPDGLAQDAVINIENRQTHAQRGLVINPFTAQFTVHDEFQKP